MLLQRVAEATYDQAEEPVHLDRDEASLRATLELGLLESNDDGITFSDPNVRRDYLVRYTVDLALQAWDDPEMFADFFEDAQYRTLDFGTRRELTTVVLLVLAGNHGKDVVERVGEITRLGIKDEGRNHLFWSLYHPFCEALPELNVDPSKLADTLDSVFEATTGDLAGGFVYGAAEKLASRSRADAEALYEVFASRPDSPVVSFTANALVGLAGFDLPEAHRRALDLTRAEQPTLRRAGIAALGRFNYANGEASNLLEATWERLDTLKAERDSDIDGALARAYGDLLDQKGEGVTEALVELSAREDSAAQIQVASVLFKEASEAYGEPWFRRALLNLARVPTSRAGTWRELDHCTARCAEHAPDLVVEFMEAAVVSRAYGTEGREAELPKILDFTFSKLVQHHPEALKAAVTRWFASSEYRLHRAAADVVHDSYDLLSTEQPWLELDKPVLDTLDEQTTVYTLQRIMGHVVSSRPLAALLLSAVRKESGSSAFLNFVAEALAGYVLYNYPNEAGGYLRSRVESGEGSDAELKVAEAALSHLDAYSKALRDLPRLKEFQTPSWRLYLLRLAEHKQQAAIMEEANRQSVVMSLATRVPLKYGRGFFMEREGNFTEPSNLSSFSHSVERPRGELIDPIGQAVQRMEWQSAGLHEDQVQDQPDEEADP
jgi:hypothetical protein